MANWTSQSLSATKCIGSSEAIQITEFNYGDPLPLPIERRNGKRRSDELSAKQFAATLRTAANLYLRDADGVRDGLAIFDRELPNIRHFQAWAARLFADLGDRLAAELCRDYSLYGSLLSQVRLHASDWVHWNEVCVAACRHLGERSSEGRALANLGASWKELGKAKKAIELYEQSLAIARETGDRDCQMGLFLNFGAAWVALGDAIKAIGFYDQSLAIARENGDRRSEAGALTNLGASWTALGNARKAIEFHDQCLAIARETGDRRREEGAYLNLGVAWAALGHARKAIWFYEQMLAVAREIGDSRSEGFGWTN